MAQRILSGFLVVLMVFCGQWSYAQRSVADSLFARFRGDILAEMKANNGCLVWDSETKESYFTFLSVCTVEDLLRHLNDSIPAVRANMFSGIGHKTGNKQLLKSIAEDHKSDTAVFRECGCVAVSWTVAMFMEISSKHANRKLTEEDYKEWLASVRYPHIVTIPGLHHGVMAREMLKELDSLSCTITGFRISSFTLSTQNTNKSLTRLGSSGAGLTPSMKESIGRLRSGDKVFIEDLKIVDSEGTERLLASFVFRVE